MIINSNQNQIFKIIKKLRDSSAAKETGQFLAEGETVIRSLCESIEPEYLVFSENTSKNSAFQDLSKKYDCKVFNNFLFKEISGLQNPAEGILAVFSRNAFSDVTNNIQDLSQVLILENIQDPGNLGTLIRTAVLLGWKNIILLDNCCDPYSNKTIRASAGAVIHAQIFIPEDKQIVLELLLQHDFDILATTGHTDAIALSSYQKNKSNQCLVLGNEGNGLTDFWLKNKQIQKIKISMQNIVGVDSLNVSIAGAILMYNLRTL